MIKDFILKKIEEKCSVDLIHVEDVKLFFQIIKNNNMNLQECHIQIDNDDIFNEFISLFYGIQKVYIYTKYNNIKQWKKQSKQYPFTFIYCISDFNTKNKQNIIDSDFTLLSIDPDINLNNFINNPNWTLFKDIIYSIYIEPNFLSLKWNEEKIERYRLILDTLFSAWLNSFSYNYNLFLTKFSYNSVLNMPFYEKDNCIYINLIKKTVGFDKICSNYTFLSGIQINESGIINVLNANMFLNMYFLNLKNKNFFGLNAICSGDWMVSTKSFYFQLKNIQKENMFYRFNQIERILNNESY